MTAKIQAIHVQVWLLLSHIAVKVYVLQLYVTIYSPISSASHQKSKGNAVLLQWIWHMSCHYSLIQFLTAMTKGQHCLFLTRPEIKVFKVHLKCCHNFRLASPIAIFHVCRKVCWLREDVYSFCNILWLILVCFKWVCTYGHAGSFCTLSTFLHVWLVDIVFPLLAVQFQLYSHVILYPVLRFNCSMHLKFLPETKKVLWKCI